MRPEERDIALLWDMLEAARSIESFMADVAASKFESDKMLRSAVERQLLIIGEAAARMSKGLREAHPEVPWRSIVGQRNVLAHEYGEVLVERLWLVATERIPELIQQLARITPDRPD